MVYIIVFLVLSIFVLVEPKNKSVVSRALFSITLFYILLIFIGLRDYVGTDWNNYLEHFRVINNKNDFHMESGYIEFVKIVKYIFNDYNALVFIIAFVFLLLLFSVFYRQPYIGIVVLLFFSGQLFGLMGANRQIIAISICVVAGELLYKKHYKMYFLSILIATTFHISSIIFLIMLWVKKYSPTLTYKKCIKYIVISIVISLFMTVFKGEIINMVLSLPYIKGKFENQLIVYTSNQFQATELVQYLVVIKRILFFMLICLFCKVFINKDINKAFDILGDRFKFYLLAFCLSIIIVCILQGIFSVIATRGSAYLYIYEIFTFSYLAKSINERYIISYKVLIVIFCAFRLSTQFLVDYDLFIPYKAVWYNTEYLRVY